MVTKKQTNKSSIKKNSKKSQDIYIVAAVACPVGIAHTYMAGEALEKAAKEKKYSMRVEYHGASGLEGELSSLEVEKADIVILSLGKGIDESKFFGKKIYYTKPGKTIKNPCLIIETALKEATVNSKIANSEPSKFNSGINDKKIMSSNIIKPSFKKEISHNGFFKGLFSYRKKRERYRQNSTGGGLIVNSLLNGVGWMIPVVVAGGILFAIVAGLGPTISPNSFKHTKTGVPIPGSPNPGTFWYAIQQVGIAGLTLMIAVLGGFIAVGMADKLAFAPAFILSWTSNLSDSSPKGLNFTFYDYTKGDFGLSHGQLGFLGAILIGIIVGSICRQIKKVKWPSAIKPIIPIIIVPVCVTLFVWVLLAFILCLPIAYIINGIVNGINQLNNKGLFVLLGPILGFLIASDMGGPLNKIAFTFGASLLAGNADQFKDGALIMGANGAAVGVPPIGMAIAAFVGKKFGIMDQTDRDLAKGSILLGCMGVTEGAIPFAVKYPKSAIPSNIIGGVIAATIAAAASITNAAAHGSLIVYLFGAVGRVKQGSPAGDYAYGLIYVGALLIGSIITATSMLFLTKVVYKNRRVNSNINTSKIFG